jgi:hypothetical protein
MQRMDPRVLLAGSCVILPFALPRIGLASSSTLGITICAIGALVYCTEKGLKIKGLDWRETLTLGGLLSSFLSPWMGRDYYVEALARLVVLFVGIMGAKAFVEIILTTSEKRIKEICTITSYIVGVAAVTERIISNGTTMLYFNEPSHFALGMWIPLLLTADCAKTRVALAALALYTTELLLYPNSSVAVIVLIGWLLVIKRTAKLNFKGGLVLSVSMIAISMGMLNGSLIEHISLRVNPSEIQTNNTQTTLVIMDGIERMKTSLKTLHGVGFENAGNTYNSGDYRNVYREMLELKPETSGANASDCGGNLYKYVTETGLIGLMLILPLLSTAVSAIIWKLRFRARSSSPIDSLVACLGGLILYQMLIRGLAYSSAGFLGMFLLNGIIRERIQDA